MENLHETSSVNSEIPLEIVGILGGLGPETSSKFMADLIREATTTRRPAVCHWNLPLDLKKEQEFIATGANADHYRALLSHGAQALEKAGCTRLVMPCNTVHEFHKELTHIVKVPFPNLIEVVGQEIKRRTWSTVLLLATSRTIQTRLYQGVLSKLGIEAIAPNDDNQKKLDLLIQGLLKDFDTSQGKELLSGIVDSAGVDDIVLGCTDLQHVFRPSAKIIDSMQCLVNHTVGVLLGDG